MVVFVFVLMSCLRVIWIMLNICINWWCLKSMMVIMIIWKCCCVRWLICVLVRLLVIMCLVICWLIVMCVCRKCRSCWRKWCCWCWMIFILLIVLVGLNIVVVICLLLLIFCVRCGLLFCKLKLVYIWVKCCGNWVSRMMCVRFGLKCLSWMWMILCCVICCVVLVSWCLMFLWV